MTIDILPYDAHFGLRPEQSQYMNLTAKFFGSSKKIMLAQADPGIGKTKGYIVASLSIIEQALLNETVRPRFIVATNTRALRDQVVAEVDEINPKSGNTKLSVAIRQSLTELASIKVAAYYRSKITTKNGYSIDEETNAREYYAWVCDCYEYFDNDLSGLPYLTDWPDELPVLHNPDDNVPHYLTDEERETSDPVLSVAVKAFKDDMNRSVADCDIIVTTHTMLLFNNDVYGKILDTDNGSTRPTYLIVDEADQLYSTTKATHAASLDVDGVKRFSSSVGISRKKCASDLINFFRIGKGELDKNGQDQLCLLLVNFITEAEKALTPGELGQSFRFDEIRDLYHDIMSYIHDHDGDTAYKGFRLIVNNGRLLLRPDPALVINRIWRNSRNKYEKILFTSATLLDLNNKFQTMEKLLGVGNKDRTNNLVERPEVIHVKSFGRIDKVYFAERSLNKRLNPSKDRDQVTFLPDIEYIRYIAECVISASNDDKRTVVHFTSSAMKIAVFAALPPTIQNRVFVKKPKQTFTSALREFYTEGKQFWFGHDWHGSNFVLGGQTIIQRVMVPATPISPPTDIGKSDIFFEGGLRLRQGIGRGIRFKDDAPDVWFCDPRMVIPSHIRSVRSYERIPDACSISTKEQWIKIAEYLPARLFVDVKVGFIDYQNGTLTIRE